MFELWDNDSRNMIDSFRTAASAEAVLAAAYREHGPEILRSLFLMHENGEDDIELVAEGEAIFVAIKRLAAAEREEVSHLTGPDRRMG